MSKLIPRVAITPGEPAGIGPDLCVLSSQTPFLCEPVVYADPGLLTNRAQQLGVPLQLNLVDFSKPAAIPEPGQLSIQPVELKTSVTAGLVDISSASYVLESLTQATNACMKGSCDALCTGPVHKGIINEAR